MTNCPDCDENVEAKDEVIDSEGRLWHDWCYEQSVIRGARTGVGPS